MQIREFENILEHLEASNIFLRPMKVWAFSLSKVFAAKSLVLPDFRFFAVFVISTERNKEEVIC